MFLFIVAVSGLRAADAAKAVPVAADLYAVEGLEGGNVAFLVTPEGVLVVDSGTSPEAGQLVMDEIATKTDRPVKYLILTHYHGDHTFGLQSFPPSTVIIAQQNTADNMRSLNGPRIQGMLEKRLPEMIAAQKLKVEELRKKKSKNLKQEEGRLREIEARLEELQGFRFVFPAVTFQTKLTVFLGGQEVEVVHFGRGHTDGDAVVSFPGLKVAHMGDLFFNSSLPYIGAEAGADTANWLATLQRVAGWGVETFIPGHGPVSDREGLLRSAAYLADLRRVVQEAVATGQTLEQVKKLPLPAAWKDMRWAESFPQNLEAVYNELKKK
jgi:glyoxylase-like metal-dependent hydrolase (beta-lactamase superfamily II)